MTSWFPAHLRVIIRNFHLNSGVMAKGRNRWDPQWNRDFAAHPQWNRDFAAQICFAFLFAYLVIEDLYCLFKERAQMEAIQVLQLQTDAKHRRITGQVKKSCRCF